MPGALFQVFVLSVIHKGNMIQCCCMHDKFLTCLLCIIMYIIYDNLLGSSFRKICPLLLCFVRNLVSFQLLPFVVFGLFVFVCLTFVGLFGLACCFLLLLLLSPLLPVVLE